MGTVGLEPTRLAALDPKSSPSANSGTSPDSGQDYKACTPLRQYCDTLVIAYISNCRGILRCASRKPPVQHLKVRSSGIGVGFQPTSKP